MAFADATVEASADFARFDREFPARLRQSVTRATRTVVSEFRRAGVAAGRAFADSVTTQFSRITRSARLAGAEAGRAFAAAAESFTTSIDVGFNLGRADGARLGQQFRTAAERFTQRIPVSFRVNPNARAVGRITGQRFRAGAMEFTQDIPVTFDQRRVPGQGTAGGRAYRAAASAQTAGIPVSFSVRDANDSLAGITPLLARITAGFTAAVRASLGLSRAVATVAALTTALTTMTAVLGEAVFAVAALARDLAGLGPILSGLGLAFSSIAVAGIGGLIATTITLGLAFRGVGDAVSAGLEDDLGAFNEALQELTPSAQLAARAMATFARPFRDLVQERFFAQITNDLDELVAAGPRVQTTFGNIAAGLGTLFSALLRTSTTAPVLDRLALAGNNIGAAFTRLSTSVGPVLRAISLLALDGSARLSDLAGAAEDAALAFEGWVTRGIETGAIDAALKRVVETLRSLFTVARNIGTIFAGIDASIQRVTGSTAGIGTALQVASQALANFVQSEEGMLLLDTFFAGLRASVIALRPALQALPSLLAPLATLIGSISTGLGPGLATGIRALSEGIEALAGSGIAQGFGAALGQTLAAIGRGLVPVLDLIGRLTAALGPGLEAGLDALGRGLQALVPAAGPVGAALGGLLETIGLLSEVILSASAPLLQVLAIALTQVLAALNPVLQVFARVVSQVATAFAEWIASPQVQAAIQRGMDLLAELGNTLVSAFAEVGPILAQTATEFLNALLPALGLVQRAIIDSGLLEAIGQLAIAFSGLLVDGLRTLAPLLAQIATTIATTLDQNAVPALQAFFNAISQIVLKIAEWMADPATSALFVQLITNMGNLFLVLAQEAGPLIQVFTDLAIAIIPLIPDFIKLSIAASQLLIPLVTLFAQIAGSVGIPVLAAGLRGLVRAFNLVITPVTTFFEIFNKVKTAIEDFDLSDITTAFSQLGTRISEAVSNIPQLLADAFTNAVNFAFESLGFALGSIIRVFFELGTRIGDALSSLKETVVTFFKNLFNDPIGTITGAVDRVVEIVVGLGTRLGEALTTLKDNVKNSFSEMWENAKTAAKEGVDKVVDFVRGLPGRLRDFLGRLEDIGKELIQAFGRGLSNLGGTLGDIASKIGNALKNFVNDNVIGALERGIERAFPLIDINIPRLAKGAYLTAPTVALVAERGPEVVIPLNDRNRAQQLADESGLSDIINVSRQNVTNVRVYIGERELSEIIRFETDEAMTVQGEALLAGPRVLGA